MDVNRQGISNITVETRRDGTTVASELFAKYPCRLHLTRPKGGGNSANHIDEDEGQHKPSVPKALTCYVLGYGGGLISGDGIEMNIHVKENAKLVITSQSTSKAFKAIPGRDATVVKTRARVARGGLLFLVPQPMQCFGQSVLSQETEVLLDYCGVGSGDNTDTDTNLNAVSKGNGCGPSLLLVDWYTGGRENLDGGMWQLSSYHTKTSVSYRNKQGNEVENDDYDDFRHDDDCGRKCVFHDATRLSGGEDLKRHMRGFNIVAMVVLLGPKVEQVASEFMKKYSSRRIYDDDGNGENFESNASKTMDFNKGDGLNRMHEGLLVSCGRFTTCAEGNHQSGVVLRLAASTLEVAANFLSKEIGTLQGQLEDDPFLEILAFKQSSGDKVNKNSTRSPGESEKVNNNDTTKASFGLIANSHYMNNAPKYDPPAGGKEIKHTLNPLTLYQLVDSCVPSGGFAHSNTLEAAHQLHLLNCDKRNSWRSALYRHIWDVILTTTTSTLPFLLSASRLFQSDEYDITTVNKWEELDRKQRTMTTSQVASRASTTQGTGMLRAFTIAFPDIAPGLKLLKKKILRVDPIFADSTGHAATVFGAVCGMLHIDEETSCSMFLYTTARDMVNAAVRMNLIGPLEGGRLTNDLCCAIKQLLEQDVVVRLEGSDINEDFAHQVCPLVEILSNAHDRLYTRLFNS